MPLPKTFWLTLTNIVLGAFVAVCFLVVTLGPLFELFCRRRRRRSYEAEIGRDLQQMFGSFKPQCGAPAAGRARAQELLRAARRGWHRISHR